MKHIKSKRIQLKTKRTFLKLGTCSRTFFYILNCEFGYPLENEERAIDSLAGGIMQQGYQCGMLWGASMAVGAESFRRSDNPDQAIALTIRATQHIMESFVNRAKASNARTLPKLIFQTNGVLQNTCLQVNSGHVINSQKNGHRKQSKQQLKDYPLNKLICFNSP